MIQRISKITIYVNNQQEAKKFWTEKIGFKVILEQPMGPNATWIEVGTDTLETTFILYEKRLMLQQKPNANVGHPSIILSTNDISKTYQSMEEKGVKVDKILEMPYGKMYTFYDPDGNPYLLREDK